MKPGINRSPKHMANQEMRKSTTKYLISFLIMAIFTAVAFYLVAFPIYDMNTTFWIILVLAIIQAILQLFTFMHLDQKGYEMVIILLGVGIVIAVVSAVGIILMD